MKTNLGTPTDTSRRDFLAVLAFVSCFYDSAAARIVTAPQRAPSSRAMHRGQRVRGAWLVVDNQSLTSGPSGCDSRKAVTGTTDSAKERVATMVAPTRASPEVPHMAELVRTNDPGVLSVIEGLLGGADIPYQVTDRNMSVIEGSISAIQIRILVPNNREAEARVLLIDAELGHWLSP